jgi:hypothetical protein
MSDFFRNLNALRAFYAASPIFDIGVEFNFAGLFEHRFSRRC